MKHLFSKLSPKKSFLLSLAIGLLVTSCGSDDASEEKVASNEEQQQLDSSSSMDDGKKPSNEASPKPTTLPELNANGPASELPFAKKLSLAKYLFDGKPSRKLTAIQGPGKFHGIHGITVNSAGEILVGSVVGQAIHKLDPISGKAELYKAPPYGMADDLEEGPNGVLAWTSFLDGKVYAQRPGGKQIVIASGYPGANSIAFNAEGRLFFTQVFAGDALYELDITGKTPPRKILEDIGGLNGFDFGPDGKLYGPLWFKGQVVRVDVDQNTLEVVAEGFNIPAALNFDSKGRMIVADTAEGTLVEVDIADGKKYLLQSSVPSIDNLAIDDQDRILFTNMADNSVTLLDPESGDAKVLTSDGFGAVSDIAIYRRSRGRDVIFSANVFSSNQYSIRRDSWSEMGRVFDGNTGYALNVGTSDNFITFSSFNEGRADIFSWKGKFIDTIHNLGGIGDAVALDNNLLAYVNHITKSVILIDIDDQANPIHVYSGFSEPAALIIEDDNHLLLTDRASGIVYRLNLETGKKLPFIWGLKKPEGFDISPQGDLIIAEVGAQRLLQIVDYKNQANPLKKALIKNIPIGLNAPEGNNEVFLTSSVAISSDGKVYFSSDIDSAIYLVEGITVR